MSPNENPEDNNKPKEKDANLISELVKSFTKEKLFDKKK